MYRIGVDLGGTNIAVGLVSNSNGIFKLENKLSRPTGRERAGEYIVADIAEACRELCAEADVTLKDIEAIGVATPGIANHDEGIVEYANNLKFKHFPLAKMLSEQLGFENVHIENDANAAAWGEAVAGAAAGSKNSVMITLGTGVGGGIIIENKLLTGNKGLAGESLLMIKYIPALTMPARSSVISLFIITAVNARADVRDAGKHTALQPGLST